MANFQVSITDPTTSQADITDANDVLTIKDHSNYDDAAPEAGHNQADFSDFRKMKIVLPTGTSYLFSSLGDGDADLATPAGESLPLSTAYSYTTGDGQYWIYLYVLPTWDAAYTYDVSTVPHVYYSGGMYKCIQTGSNKQPDTETAYWEEITDVDNLSSKYRLAKRIVVYSDMKEQWARLVYNSVVINNGVGVLVDQLMHDQEWRDAMKLYFDISALPVLMKVDAWTEVDTIINFGKTLIAKYES